MSETTTTSPVPCDPHVFWSVDDEGDAFPSMRLGGLVREAWHSVSCRTSWVDGHCDGPGGMPVPVDVVALAAPDAHFERDDFDLAATRAAAAAAWEARAVHLLDGAPVTTLVAPVATLDGDTLAEVLARFRP